VPLAIVVTLTADGCASAAISPCNGTKVFQQGATDPIVGASGSGDLAQVQLLVRTGHDVNFQECEDESKDEVDIARWGWTPLMVAAMGGHLEVIRYLVDAGAKLETKTSGGETALDLAVRAGRAEAADLLEQLGAAR
jgi:ankyrin repeat protein